MLGETLLLFMVLLEGRAPRSGVRKYYSVSDREYFGTAGLGRGN